MSEDYRKFLERLGIKMHMEGGNWYWTIKSLPFENPNKALENALDMFNLINKEPVETTCDWIVWSGWAGNHDARIEGATCSRCGYKHPTVYQSTSLLSKKCPGCGATMGIREQG